MRWLTKLSQNCALCFHIFSKKYKIENIVQISLYHYAALSLKQWKTLERFQNALADTQSYVFPRNLCHRV